tara:strand:- start:59 stop:610 length:552 start_codon:yes stop_codon:yes gene_type:complete
MSTIRVDNILKRTGTGTITLGQSGDTISIPSGTTLAVSGTATGVGGTNTPYFHVNRNGSDQSGFSNSTPTVIQFTNEVFDSGNYYDTSAYTWTPSAGTYFVYAQVRFQFDTETDIGLELQKNGSDLFHANNRAKYYSVVRTSGLVSMNGTDNLQLKAVQHSGSSQSLSGGNQKTFFGGFKIIT